MRLRFLIGLVCLSCACSRAEEEREVTLTESDLRARTRVQYESVDMYQPVAGEHTDIDVYLAPMVYREHPAGEPSIDGSLEFAGLDFSGDQVSLDMKRPTVYTYKGNVSHAGMDHEQLTFLWFRQGEMGRAIGMQGLRMTFDSDGYPAVYEVFSDHSGKSIFYVSKALEELARSHVGGPLAGRMYCVEPDADERPDVLMLRLVQQGAEPLGPLLYDAFDTSDLIQLHCRCAPSQLKAIGASVKYELVAMDSFSKGERRRLAKTMGWGDSSPDLGFPAPIWPWTSLRLPDVF